jgi:1,4-alpha-glucan branching enzyme
MERSNAWLNAHFHEAAARLVDLAERFPNESGLKERALNQAPGGLLMQCSTGPTSCARIPARPSRAPRRRVRGGLHKIYDMLSCNAIDTEWLTKLEKRDNVFPFINYRMWRRKR